MKRNFAITLSVLIITAFTIASCTKNEARGCDTVIRNADSNSVVGVWERKAEFNGMGGSTLLPDCNGNRIEFVDSNSYKSYNNWQLVSEGTYRIFPDTFRLLQVIRTRIVFDNNSQPRQFIVNTGSHLSFSIDANDGPGVDYVRRNSVGQ